MSRRPPTARALAAAVLAEVGRTHGFSNRVLGEHLERAASLERRDRGLATALVYGVLRHRGRLDALIDACADRPHRLGPAVRELLRIGTLELRELGHPAHAAISEAVNAARALPGGNRVTGVVQAVLSRVEREGTELDAALETGTPLDVLEKRWSIPRWWAGRWLKALGPERALARARALAETPGVELRVDLSRTTVAEVIESLATDAPEARVEEVPGTPGALRVHGGSDLFFGPLHDDGLISVQSVAAQQPARVLAPGPGERVLDACAGRGVKTLQLAELMERRGTLVAADVDEHRLAKLESALARGAVDGSEMDLQVRVLDVTAGLPEALGRFDAVLLDAPCTGLGNVGRHPEIRWNRSFEDIGARAELQRSLLHRCLDALAPGGRLVYAVCSLEPEEGPQVVEAVATERGVTITDQRTWTPEDDGVEGFYVARLQG